jgi:MinD-like ATPase involved in chromosome partitioning or flagellar assembly
MMQPATVTPLLAFSSFTRGTGRSTLIAALALRLAQNKRVLVVDTDLPSPNMHNLLGLGSSAIKATLNDFFVGLVGLDKTLHTLQVNPNGALLLLPASDDTQQVACCLRESYPIESLFAPLQALCEHEKIDLVLLDMPSGLSDTTLPVIAFSDALWVVMRLDVRDYEGVAVTLDVARRLEPRPLHLVVNLVQNHTLEDVERQVSSTYGCSAHALPFVAPLTHLPDSETRLNNLVNVLLEPQKSV